MRTSKTLQKLRDNQTARVCSLGHYIPHFIRHAAHFNFDCIWLDLEHRCLENREVQALLAFSHLADIDIMVRPPTLEKTRLYRYLEDGATGLMIPHVSTAEKAQMLVDAVRFPPVGDRGIDGVGLDSDFSYDGPRYTEMANEQTFLTVQIETPEAIANVEEIAAVDGVDVLFVGPGDLSLRIANSSTDLTLETAFERTAAACEKHGKAWGCPVPTADDLAKRQNQGAKFLAHGGDFMALVRMLEAAAEAFDSNSV